VVNAKKIYGKERICLLSYVVRVSKEHSADSLYVPVVCHCNVRYALLQGGIFCSKESGI
jgi:hypothetical protein